MMKKGSVEHAQAELPGAAGQVHGHLSRSRSAHDRPATGKRYSEKTGQVDRERGFHSRETPELRGLAKAGPTVAFLCFPKRKKERHLKKGSTKHPSFYKTGSILPEQPRADGPTMRRLHPIPPRAGERATRWDEPCHAVPVPSIPTCLADGWLTSPSIPTRLADGWLTSPSIPACLADGWLTSPSIPACLADGWLTSPGTLSHPHYENIEIRFWRDLG